MNTATCSLVKEMQNPAFDLQAFLHKNRKNFKTFCPNEIWQDVIAGSNMSKSAIIRESGISYAFFYDIINGKKIPSRDKVLRLIFAMHLSVERSQELLTALHMMPLNVQSRRDTIILYALSQNFSVDKASYLLEECFEAPLK